jgi:molecular chaperone GrpE
MKHKQSEEQIQDDNKAEELINDLQRLRADFENYRKRIDQEKQSLMVQSQAATIMRLLPVVDTIERAIAHTPEHLAEDKWVQGIVGLGKNLDKSLAELGLTRIIATPGTPFNPELHEAVMMDDEATGEHEVVAEELRAGYTLNGAVVRPSMVKVTRQ